MTVTGFRGKHKKKKENTSMTGDAPLDTLSPEERAQKIQSLRDMISSAERTIQSAKSMLLQIEGKKKVGRKRKVSDEDGTIIEGTFDGQVMIGTDGKQYPVPANYASKSKLVEGDVLKLTITPDSTFIYKQIGPAPRKNAIGIISQDERGNYYAVADGKPYKILLASVTYFRVEPGDEVAIVVPLDENASWAVIESVLSRAETTPPPVNTPPTSSQKKEPSPTVAAAGTAWSSDIRDIEEEIKKTHG